MRLPWRVKSRTHRVEEKTRIADDASPARCCLRVLSNSLSRSKAFAWPAVGVWTAEHLGAFLADVADDSLFALWWLTALRGLHRGEACGLRWSEVDLDHGFLFIVRNGTTAGYHVIEGAPRTAAGVRAIALDRHTVKILREYCRRGRRMPALCWPRTEYRPPWASGPSISEPWP